MLIFAFLVLTFFKLLRISTGFYKKGAVAAAVSRIRIAIAGVLKTGRLTFCPGGVWG